MKTDYGRHEAADGLPSEELFRPKAKGGSSAWKRWTALGGIGGAALSGALGAGALLGGRRLEDMGITLMGDVLLFAVIPLVMLGATALDWLEDDLRAERDGAPVRNSSARRPVPGGASSSTARS